MYYLRQFNQFLRINLNQGQNLIQRVQREVQNSQSLLFKVYIPICILILIIWAVIKASGISPYYFVADPAEITGQKPYIGIVSVIGNLIWCAIAAICFFTFSLLQTRPKLSKILKRFILCSGLFSTFLLLDDTFQIHEQFYDIIFTSGSAAPDQERLYRDIVEIFVFLIYGCIFTAYLFHFKSIIRKTEVLFLLLAFLFFGLSTVVDMTHKHDFLEESLKLLGISSWFIYFFRFCKHSIVQHFLILSWEKPSVSDLSH